jgi:U4/U6 small nuclear ribonucleoprotein PRP3
VDLPPSKEERPRRERRRFEDVDENGKNGDMGKWGKEISSHELQKEELSINGGLQSCDAPNVSVITVAEFRLWCFHVDH